MKGVLRLKDIPFLLTILFGLLGFHLSEINKSILNSPSIEYDFKVKDTKIVNGVVYKNYVYLITNITTDKSFKNLTINFDSRKSSQKVFNPTTIAIEPSSLHFITPESIDSIILIYTISTFQPGEKYQLKFQSIAKEKYKDFNPSLYMTSDSTVRIIEKSFTTWLVKNFIMINTVLILVWTTLIFLYLFKIKENENTSSISS